MACRWVRHRRTGAAAWRDDGALCAARHALRVAAKGPSGALFTAAGYSAIWSCPVASAASSLGARAVARRRHVAGASVDGRRGGSAMIEVTDWFPALLGSAASPGGECRAWRHRCGRDRQGPVRDPVQPRARVGGRDLRGRAV